MTMVSAVVLDAPASQATQATAAISPRLVRMIAPTMASAGGAPASVTPVLVVSLTVLILRLVLATAYVRVRVFASKENASAARDTLKTTVVS